MRTEANPIASMRRRYDLTQAQLARILEIGECYVAVLEEHGCDVPRDVLRTIETWIVDRRDWLDA